jgi:hypothetical protein
MITNTCLYDSLLYVLKRDGKDKDKDKDCGLVKSILLLLRQLLADNSQGTEDSSRAPRRAQ